MSTITITGRQTRAKNCFAVSEELGLVLVSNGEEYPYLLTPLGHLFTAGMNKPTGALAVADDGGGLLTANKYVRYAATYSIDGVFPLVTGGINLRSNPLYDIPSQITNQISFGIGGNRKMKVTVDAPTDLNITHVHFFRTSLHDTLIAANLAADAGDMFYMGRVLWDKTATPIVFHDNTLANEGFELITLYNHVVPNFKYCVWDGDYFWGFGNHPLYLEATWDEDGNITLDPDGEEKFYPGRQGQAISFEGITTGGFDGQGTFTFNYGGPFVGATNALPATIIPGSGQITLQGEGSVLYRSGYRNPFSWGRLRNVGGIYVPELWQLKISGGIGTAIAVMPNQDLLKLDMEFPTLSVTYNRNAAATEQFEFTRQRVSTVYSVTSHFSQFAATNNGRTVLWGMDFKNTAILEFDGVNQTPISGPISTLLRTLSKDRVKHLLCHGLQDSNLEINAIWCSTNDSDTNASFLIDYCIYCHWPTGFWGVVRDYGILCSATIEDVVTSQRITMVGTETGFLGRAFDPEALGNWLPGEGIYQGTVSAAGANTITRTTTDGDFSITDDNVVGNHLLVVSPDGLSSQIRLIVGATNSVLMVDHNFNPLPLVGSRFYVGLIEVSLLKYFDAGEPSKDVKPIEYWLGLGDADEANPPTIHYYPEHSSTPTKSVLLQRDAQLDSWFAKKGFPTKLGKTFGLAVVDRSYAPIRFYNFTIKS